MFALSDNSNKIEPFLNNVCEFSTNELEDDFFCELESIFENSQIKISENEYVPLIKAIISITKEQTEIYINQINFQNQYFQPQSTFCNNIYFPPLLNEEMPISNFYLQNIPMIQQQQYYFPQLTKRTKQNKKSYKKQKRTKQNKKKANKKVKNENKNEIESFNNLPLKSQQNAISKIIKKEPKDISIDILKNINDILLYILHFDPQEDEHYFSFSTHSNETSIERGLKNLKQIELSHKFTELLTEKNSLDSSEFINQIKKFEHVLIEIKIPSQKFRTIYEKVLNLKRQNEMRIRIGIFISNNSSAGYMILRDNRYIYSAKFDSSITRIENRIFKESLNLREVSIPSSVTIIGECAFFSCSLLSEITIPSSCTSIGNRCFKKCSSITRLIIPSSVRSIGEGAFFGCSSLTEIEIPSSMTSISASLFSGCSSLRSVRIPDSIVEIQQRAFKGCSSLTRVDIPPHVRSIEECSFFGCSSLTEITIPSEVTSIQKRAFKRCSSLTRIAIPSSVKTIGENAFNGCISLAQIDIPSSVNSIGSGAFRGCSALSNISMSSVIQPSRLGLNPDVNITWL